MTISEQGKSLAEDFSFMEDWTEKYQYMIDLSKSLDEMDSEFKTEDNLIKAIRPVLLPKTPIKFVLFNSIKLRSVEFPTMEALLGMLGGLLLTFKFRIELA